MELRGRTKGVVLAVLALALAAVPLLGIAPAAALPSTTTFTSGKSSPESAQHTYQSSDGEVAYCGDGERRGPDGASYTAEPKREAGRWGYICYHGYPRTTKINGTTFSEGQARDITQWAIWISSGWLTRQGRLAKANSSEGWEAGWIWYPFDDASQAEKSAALALVDGADAWARSGGGGPEAHYALVYHQNGGNDRQRMVVAPRVGSLTLAKASAATSVTKGSDCYSLSGATYRIYTDEACKRQATTLSGDRAELVTGSDGTAPAVELEVGTYYVREAKAPRGFALDRTVHKVEVRARGRASVDGSRVVDSPVVGDASLLVRKVDGDLAALADGAGTSTQGDAALAGVEFEVSLFDNQEGRTDGDPIATWTLSSGKSGVVALDEEHLKDGSDVPSDASGRACLPLGTYEVSETKAPRGYERDDARYVATLAQDGDTAKWKKVSWPDGDSDARTIPDEIVRGGIEVEKRDLETGGDAPLGGASLEGATFSVYNASPSTVVVGGNSYAPGEEIDEARMVTDAKGYAATSKDLLPYGTYRVVETASPTGYLDGRTSGIGAEQTVEVREGDTLATLPEGPTRDQVVRGDFSFTKKEAGSMEPMSGVAFSITSLTTGESHVVVSDGNGRVDTSASWNAHTHSTNGNDRLLDGDGASDGEVDPSAGVWFSGGSDGGKGPDDTRGALPFDTYEVRELATDASSGHKLVSFKVTVVRDGADLDLGTVDDAALPSLQTAARGDAGDLLALDDKATVTDTVYYANVETGATYTIRGWLVDTETGEVLRDGDGTVEAKRTFTAKATAGNKDMTFEVDTTQRAGRSVTVFEQLLDEKGNVIASHEDPNDTEQTVRVAPSILTSACDGADGDKVVPSVGTVRIVDSVSYDGLEAGVEYQVRGRLVDRETGETIEADDGPVSGTTTFTPSEASGTVDVSFSFDGSLVRGRTVVVFEGLYQGTEEVCKHESTEDEAQTIETVDIGTKATDGTDGDKVASALDKAKVVDTVSYENLEPGSAYHMVGTLMDAESGQPLRDAAGATVTGETEFVPESTDGTVEVDFEFDATELAGCKVVAFEQLSEGDTVIAIHQDITDEDQTVSLETPEAPEDDSDKPVEKTEGLPQTGIGIGAAILVALGVAILVATEIFRRRTHQ